MTTFRTISKKLHASLLAALLLLVAAGCAASQNARTAGPDVRSETGSAAAPTAQPTSTRFVVRVANVAEEPLASGAPFVIAPVAYAVHDASAQTSRLGQVATPGLERMAEDGAAPLLAEELQERAGVRVAGAQAIFEGADAPGPAAPGDVFTFEIEARPGERLSLWWMFGQSNDLFYATAPEGLDLFPGGQPLSGDFAGQVALLDAGTEINEEPGVGPNQAPRQAAENAGPPEDGLVRPVDDGFDYPPVEGILRVTISPAETASR